jgi:hypothetical protein
MPLYQQSFVVILKLDLKDMFQKVVFFRIQSNMCTTTTLGTQKSGRCSKGVRYKQGVPINCYQFWKIRDQAGRCRQVVVFVQN